MEFDKEYKSSDIILDVCHKTFRDIGSLKLHQCAHNGERPYCCDVCNRMFSNKIILKVHQYVDTGDTCNLKEMPLFKIRLCLIGRSNSVNIL